MGSLLQTVKAVIQRSGGFDVVANNCGYRNPNILRNQISQRNKANKLGIEDFIKIVKYCHPNSIEIIQTLAAETESIIIPVPKIKDSDTEFMKLVFGCISDIGDMFRLYLNFYGSEGIEITCQNLEMIHHQATVAVRSMLTIPAHLEGVQKLKQQLRG